MDNITALFKTPLKTKQIRGDHEFNNTEVLKVLNIFTENNAQNSLIVP